ncbi:MAG: glycogen synthase GlgA [Candidatus Omnitrophota bacterium]
MRVLLISSEMVPFAKTGGLADVCGAIPLYLEKQKVEVKAVLPFYKHVKNYFFSKESKLKRVNDEILMTKIGRNVEVYFIENNWYYDRFGLYGETLGDYQDNLARFSYFSIKALELLRIINFRADIVHCHDWQTSLIPVYLKNIYAHDDFYRGIKSVLTIHNLGYQGLFSKDEFPKLGLDWKIFNIDGLEFYDKISFLKGGILFSDKITTVSPTYSKEIQTKELGAGLQGVLLKRDKDLSGIINGLDYSLWNPSRDNLIYNKYGQKSINKKYINKQKLRDECGLKQIKVPLLGFVGRLAGQKGMDLIASSINELCQLNLQFIFLGTGEDYYHSLLGKISNEYPDRIVSFIKFDNELAHKIYAGCDIFLMPSHYEPCGLGQMISLKYGTLPLVFKTGGLSDTVNKDNGFIFDSYDKQSFIQTVKKALLIYNNKLKWRKLVQNAFRYDFSWDKQIKKYIQLYKSIK